LQRFISSGFIFDFLITTVPLWVGCGGHSGSTQPAPLRALNGNFSMAASSASTLGVDNFDGALQTDSTGHVTGLVHIFGSLFACFGTQMDLPLSGAVDSTGQFNATITGSASQIITLSASVSPDGTLLSNGSYSGSGTACVTDHGPLAGFQVQPFTGTYTTSFNPSPSTNMSISLSLVQATTPDIHGMFPITASSITITGGAACGFSSATLFPIINSADGNTLILFLQGSDNLAVMNFAGTVPSGNTSVVPGILNIADGPCTGQFALINLTRN
jgi:hypothetical protein